MKILYSGPCRPGSLTEARRKACLALGHQLVVIDQVPYIDRYSWFFRRVQLHSLIGPGIYRYNHDLVLRASAEKPDLVYIDQAALLWPETVRRLSEVAPVIHYTSEHLGFRRYFYRNARRAAPRFAAHVITNELAPAILRSWGAKTVVLTQFGYDPEAHVPVDLTEEDRPVFTSDVVFVGHWEHEYEKNVRALRDAGISVTVWGPGWSRARSLADRSRIRSVGLSEYRKVIAGAQICLGFLSKWNHNTITSRTFEIPAMGGFLLAERTPQQTALYEEDREAAFFSTTTELVETARHYLAHEGERRAVAAAGHKRCIESGWSHVDRMRDILNELTARRSLA